MNCVVPQVAQLALVHQHQVPSGISLQVQLELALEI